ncbi:hypothetical protein ACFIQG_08485, partial [Comamonas odontotermitis]|uniref:hypothetical protein n=1 Tax=Comamonas odontotermitis TaxID=379895 RepID=UPI0036710495
PFVCQRQRKFVPKPVQICAKARATQSYRTQKSRLQVLPLLKTTAGECYIFTTNDNALENNYQLNRRIRSKTAA